MKTQSTRMLLAVIALASGFGAANTASAAPHAHGTPKYGVCCRIHGADWLAPSARLCRQQHGRLVRLNACRFGKPGNGSRARGESSTHGSSHGPKARSSKRARSHTQTHGASHGPDARNHKGTPHSKPNTGGSKPNGSHAGCKPRVSVTRGSALTKSGAIATAQLAWVATVRAKYGKKYRHPRESHASCSKPLMYQCTYSALPCEKN